MEFILPIVMPQLIDVVALKVKNEVLRFVIAAVSCIVAGSIITITKSDISHMGLPAICAVVYGVSEGIFKLYWKNSFSRAALLSFLASRQKDIQTGEALATPVNPVTTSNQESFVQAVLKDIGVPR